MNDINKCCNCNCDLRNYTPVVVDHNVHACSTECAEMYLQKQIVENDSAENIQLLNG